MTVRRTAVALLLLAAIAAITPAVLLAQGTNPNEPTTICHYTGDPQQPYAELTLSGNAIDGHLEHDLDVIPRPSLGCPTLLPGPDPDDPATATATPTPTPAATTSPAPAETVICHAASRRPVLRYDELTVTPEQIEAHAGHEFDLIPAPAGGCPPPARRTAGGGGDDDPEPAPTATPGSGTAAADTTGGGQAPVAASNRSLDGLPLTGARPDLVILLGLGFASAGLGLRLLLASER